MLSKKVYKQDLDLVHNEEEFKDTPPEKLEKKKTLKIANLGMKALSIN